MRRGGVRRMDDGARAFQEAGDVVMPGAPECRGYLDLHGVFTQTQRYE